jgi:hypothetical protein
LAKIALELELLELKTLQPEGLFLIVQLNQSGDFRIWIDWIFVQTYRTVGNVLTHTCTYSRVLSNLYFGIGVTDRLNGSPLPLDLVLYILI